MSTVEEELPTTISEDFGFKPLGEIDLLPGFNENVPFSRLHNLAVSNQRGLYVAAGGGKVVAGELQNLRDQILQETDGKRTLEFLLEVKTENVIYVGFHGTSDAEIIWISRTGILHRFDVAKKETTQSSINNADPDATSKIVKVQQLRGSSKSFLVLYSSKNLYSVTESGDATLVAEKVCDLDVGKTNWALFSLDGTITVYHLGGTIIEKTIELPQDIRNEMDEDVQPLSVLALSQAQFVVVLGEDVPEFDEDAEYDHKVYVVSNNEDTGTAFHESYDIAPAFKSVVRNPTYYKYILNDLIPSIPNLFIIASATSPEITLLDEKEVLQPNQDSDRAVLPINPKTDNDTNPIGLAVDLTSSEQIPEPCSGVDFAVRLPLVFVLNNEGRLSVFALFHSSGIRSKQFSAKPSEESWEPMFNAHSRTSFDYDKDQASELSPSAGETTSLTEGSTSGEEEEIKVSRLGDQQSGKQPTSTSTTSTFGQTPFGQSPFSTKATASFGQTESTGSAFKFGSSNKDGPFSAFGKLPSPFGEKKSSAFGPPDFSLKEKESPESKSNAKKVQDNAPNSSFSTPTFGTSTFGRPDLGSKHISEQNPFSKPFFSPPSDTASPFKNALSNTNKGVGEDSSKKSGFGSGFASFATSGSPFASVGKSSSPFGTPSFPSQSAGATDLSQKPSSFGAPNFSSGSTQSPFAQLKSPFDKNAPSASPFASLQLPVPEDVAESKGDGTLDDENSTGFNNEASEASNVSSSVSSESEDSVSEDSDPNANEVAGSTAAESGEENKPSTGEQASDFSTLTERIKKVANARSETIHEPTSHEDAKPSNHLSAPTSAFSKYTATLSRGATPDFSFANIAKNRSSSSGHVQTSTGSDFKEESQGATETSGLESNDNRGASATIGHNSKELAQMAPSEVNEELKLEDSGATESILKEPDMVEASQEPQIEDKEEDMDADRGRDQNETQIPDHPKNTEEAINESDRKTSISEGNPGETTIQKNGKEDSIVTSEEDSPVNVPGSEAIAKKSSTSTENESFDELEDLEEELDQIKIGKKQSRKPSSNDSTTEPHIWSVDDSIQTQQVETSSNGTQTYFQVDDAAVVTDPVGLRDFDVQSFENDEAYLAQQYKPKPFEPFYTGAELTPVQPRHTNATLNRIEVTFRVVSAEIDVLETNMKNLRLLLSDQSSKPFSRTRETLYQTYTWRLAEVGDLDFIVDGLLTEAQTTTRTTAALSSGTQELLGKDLDDLERGRFSARRQFDQLHEIHDERHSNGRALTFKQTQMQHKLRSKTLAAQKRVQGIEDTLRLLKSHFSKDDITKAPMVTRMVKGSEKRGDLLDAIQSLRKEVAELKLKDKDFSNLSDSERTLQTVPISDLKLKFDTKKQLGDFFKCKNANIT
ncbi:FG-nucleoporin NUP159 LALA0_S04e09076g [Lachancea lanzarotensis]|uniref:LALA0S04e09076g1_1 n=1 Tax=Lachancea lanzarotensis TaxID=1245769 RepID=A0A0C7MQI4_9SACH|nr:uncharacterized protein LALA0_S04e09076g [Lachancea lanzarotensis]CEP62155.1 LALA0S04e09076g1_1 [Lachancea lanzarotensis]